nr:methanol dehydrogenase alpha subunit, MDH alpha subunit [Acetobacter methanolicus, MB58, IMET 10945, Peptide Partial, 34 aa] [Acidomonas methanolica]
NEKLVELHKTNGNWVMNGRTYEAQNYSPLTSQIP